MKNRSHESHEARRIDGSAATPPPMSRSHALGISLLVTGAILGVYSCKSTRAMQALLEPPASSVIYDSSRPYGCDNGSKDYLDCLDEKADREEGVPMEIGSGD